MLRIEPDVMYEGWPCSVVSAGCACGIDDESSLDALVSNGLRDDGYLSLDGMNQLIRANQRVLRTDYYKRGQRPTLRDWAESHQGQRAVICVLGHFVYYNGSDYYSFFDNDQDKVVKVWYLA